MFGEGKPTGKHLHSTKVAVEIEYRPGCAKTFDTSWGYKAQSCAIRRCSTLLRFRLDADLADVVLFTVRFSSFPVECKMVIYSTLPRHLLPSSDQRLAQAPAQAHCKSRNIRP